MMLDLDHFKAVNDNYGHSTGDTTLKQFAKILMDFSAENKLMAGRWGGEEFVVICLDKNIEAAGKLAEELRMKVDAYEFPEIFHISCSVGVTELKSGDDFASSFDRIDKAVYASKQAGRNKVTVL
jgi:diguanylate cyclase (GGDEF)-like protein